MDLYFTQEEKKQFLIRNGLDVEALTKEAFNYSPYGKPIESYKIYYDIAYYPNSRPEEPNVEYHGINVVFNRLLKEKLLLL